DVSTPDDVGAPDDVVAVATAAGSAPDDVVGVRSAPDDVIGAAGAPHDVGAPDNVLGTRSAPDDVLGGAGAPHDVVAVGVGAARGAPDDIVAAGGPGDAPRRTEREGVRQWIQHAAREQVVAPDNPLAPHRLDRHPLTGLISSVEPCEPDCPERVQKAGAFGQGVVAGIGLRGVLTTCLHAVR